LEEQVEQLLVQLLVAQDKVKPVLANCNSKTRCSRQLRIDLGKLITT